ncbi:hypothetical protein SSX86_026175 [Deinandra increscens subsp. villosa]|uniref:Uncharacterized protein n=1 Tax=Deinandra increscens subsp. villosa TaxID=3103831 RepID=A0AAP0GPV3_9ASTR
MEPSSWAPPYSAGSGRKFRKPPVSTNRPSTPYDRPSLTTANNNNNSDDGGGWLSKLVVNPARRLIVGGATRILPSFFSKSESTSSDEYEYHSSGDRDNEDVDATVNALGDAKHTLEASLVFLLCLGVPCLSKDAVLSSERDSLKGRSENANTQQDIGDFDQIENMIKGKQFSRDESSRLMEILKSRLVDDSNAEGGKKAASVISEGQDKMKELVREIPSTGKQYDVETPMPRFLSNMQDDVAASPIDVAKVYMGSRASELGFNTYGSISKDRRDHAHHNLFPSKPHFLTPSSKPSTCWPGAMVQDHRAYLTPKTQRSIYGHHNVPRTPYSRTKPKMKTSSDVMDGGYGSVGPIRRSRNKIVSEPLSVGPRSFSSAQIASSSNASRSFVSVFQNNSVVAATSNLHTAGKQEQTLKNDANSAGPSNEMVRKILNQLDRHKPNPKEKAAELKLATEWKRLPSQNTSSIMPVLAPVTGPNLERSGVLSENRSFLKGTDGGVSFEDHKKASIAATETFTSINDAGAGPSFGFKSIGVAIEKSAVTNSKAKEKSQPWPFDHQINGQDLTRKGPSQPILKPISFKKPDPQQVLSSNNGGGFAFSVSSNASSASEAPTPPSIMPSFPPTMAPWSQELPVTPTYSFGTKEYGEQVVFSFPSTSSAPVDDGASDLNFNFGSGKKLRVR